MGESTWISVHEYAGHEASVTAICWAPWEQGLVLAAGSSDGCVSVLTRVVEDRWESQKFAAHEGGVTALSWACTGPSSVLADSQSPPLKQFLTGGADQWVKLWTYRDGSYKPEPMHRHTHWVRDVSWAPSCGFSRQVAASCSESGSVMAHSRETGSEQWRHVEVVKLQVPVWRVAWSAVGHLAVSTSDTMARLYREGQAGNWESTGEVTEKGAFIESGERSISS